MQSLTGDRMEIYMSKVRIGIVGLGQRGAGYGMTDGSEGLLGNILKNSDNAEVTYVCDIFHERIEAAKKRVLDYSGKEPLATDDFLVLVNSGLVDAIIVATSWDNHVKVGLAAMEAGIPVGIEVGGTHNIEDCWRLVDCYEKTKTPFMFLENCCFGEDEMLATSLARNGVLGDVCYSQGYYCHDLREEITSGIRTHHYRLKEYTENNCENYPTHELGPIAKVLNINSGNRFTKLVSMASCAKGLEEYIRQRPDTLGELKDRKFAQGDVVTTMIECENGETVFLKLDTTLPRMYDRGLTFSGTKGFYCQTTKAVVLDDGRYNHDYQPYRDTFFNQNDYKDFLPDEWRCITEEQIKSGHGGMDYIMLSRFIECVAKKLPMPIDVYEGVTWMCVTALSEMSIKGGCVPVDFPDFTRGAYKTRKTVDVLELPKLSYEEWAASQK